MAAERIQTVIRFDEELLTKITYVAKRNQRSMNKQLAFLAQRCIEQYEKENGIIELSDEGKFAYRK